MDLQLQREFSEQSEALQSARHSADQSRKAKEDLDRELHSLYQQWDTDIKTQSAHFASLQATMIPARELEVMRVQMAEELEIPHRQRIDQVVEVGSDLPLLLLLRLLLVLVLTELTVMDRYCVCRR